MKPHGRPASPPAYPEPRAFLDESEALHALLQPRSESDLALATQFKGWTIEDVLVHLHVSNLACEWSVSEPERLRELFSSLSNEVSAGRTPREVQRERAGGLGGQALLELWYAQCHRLAELFARVDPRRRLPWAGPDLSARSSISARLMETWAHGQAVYDRFGIERVDSDRIRGVAVLGVMTFPWTFRNRGRPVPEVTPRVRLRAPSGASWEWNADVSTNLVEGSATEFCQVVTQTRSVADTRLRVEGAVAREWMSIAQCFAGPPEDPPAPGTRTVAKGEEGDPGNDGCS